MPSCLGSTLTTWWIGTPSAGFSRPDELGRVDDLEALLALDLAVDPVEVADSGARCAIDLERLRDFRALAAARISPATGSAVEPGLTDVTAATMLRESASAGSGAPSVRVSLAAAAAACSS